jgi:serine/threonine protein kinase
MSPAPNSAPGPSMPFPPGTVIAGGKYRVHRLLGEGGMGWVVVATHLQLEQRVALKFMRSSTNPEAVARFLREARAAARIQSEHVARVSDVGTLENGAPYLVMEYLEGEDLGQLIDAKGALPEYLALDYAIQACEGLAEAHAAGIIHRDLKPANLFLARRTDGSVRVKLLDFGISKLAPAPGSQPEINMTSTQGLMGSPLYMSPEQMRSSRTVDQRADIWSMGTIIYEMLAGRSPFDGTTLPEVCAHILADEPASLRSFQPELSPELEAIVMRCLEKKPERRYPDVAALAHALAPFGTDEIRSTADRITRVTRAKRAVAAEPLSEPAVSPRAVATSSESAIITNPLVEVDEPTREISTAALVGQTSASFTRAPASRTRSPMLPFALGGAGLAVGIGIAIALVAMRGPPAAGPPATGTGATTTGSGSIAVDTAAPTPPPAPIAPVVAATASTGAPLPDPVVAPTAAAAVVVAPTSAAPVAAPVHTAPVVMRPAPTAAKPVAKPAATTSFGGRD